MNSATFTHKAAITAAAALFAIFGMGASASAGDSPSMAKSSHVNLAGLDLSSAQGQAIAYERLHQSARTLCSRVADELDLSHHDNYLACIDNAMANAGAKLQALVSQQAKASVAQNQVK